MFVILLVHRKGGATTCTSATIEGARLECVRKCATHPASYALATLPYEAKPGALATWDTTPPSEVVASWDDSTRALYYGDAL